MLVPIRCFTCNNVLADKSKIVREHQQQGLSLKTLFEQFKLKYCCRTILMTHVEL
jgi:DNA-directed RNA polymerase subunit N (RpoN/RPB10)